MIYQLSSQVEELHFTSPIKSLPLPPRPWMTDAVFLQLVLITDPSYCDRKPNYLLRFLQ
jgi:hypothetical protein